MYNIVSDKNTDCATAIRDRRFDQVMIEDVYLTKSWNPTGYAIRHVPVPAGITMRPDAQKEIARARHD